VILFHCCPGGQDFESLVFALFVFCRQYRSMAFLRRARARHRSVMDAIAAPAGCIRLPPGSPGWRGRSKTEIGPARGRQLPSATLALRKLLPTAPSGQSEARVLRSFGRRNNGATVQIKELSGSLSDSRVLKVVVNRADGLFVTSAVAKVSTLAMIDDEGHRYRTDITRLDRRRISYPCNNSECWRGQPWWFVLCAM